MLKRLHALYDYRYMIENMVRREVRGRYKGSMLGFVWNFILPLVQIIVYIVIFSMVFKPNISNYYMYLISGMVPWIFFSEAIQSGSSAILQNSDMVQKIYFPREILPLSITLSCFVNYIITIGIVVVFALLIGFPLTLIGMAYLVIVSLIFLLFVLGISFVVSSVSVYFRDMEYIVRVVLLVLIWMVPIMYSVDGIDSEILKHIIEINPLTQFINLFHDAIYSGIVSNLTTLAICTAISALFFIGGYLIFLKLENNFAEAL